MDDQILHAHLEREITRQLVGVSTVLDTGGGTGRFSMWLAKMGYQVTHLDISLPMLAKAREKAKEMGVSERITFVHGRLTDLSAYSDGQFDLVFSLDAPVSYTYPKHNDVINELIRLATCGLVLCVTSRLGAYQEWKERDKWKIDLERVDRLWNDGLYATPDEVFEQMIGGDTPWPVTYSFRPEELAEQL
jgi:ubiquinone/menaquinone biosynthesis C-methylase UbiE